jgi:hypothetical protein
MTTIGAGLSCDERLKKQAQIMGARADRLRRFRYHHRRLRRRLSA